MITRDIPGNLALYQTIGRGGAVVADTAVGLPTVPSGALIALVMNTDPTAADHLRFTSDGSTPTAALGGALKTTDSWLYVIGAIDIAAFLMIRETANSVDIEVIYFG